jgi:hypothetical protein
VLLDGFCTCTWALDFFSSSFQRPSSQSPLALALPHPPRARFRSSELTPPKPPPLLPSSLLSLDRLLDVGRYIDVGRWSDDVGLVGRRALDVDVDAHALCSLSIFARFF